MPHFRPTRVLIDGHQLVANFLALQKHLGSSVLAVVKANAYGHGATLVAGLLEPLGVAMFGVALVEEGIALRAAGVATPILVLSPTFDAAEAACLEYQLIPVVGTFDQLEKFSTLGKQRGGPVEVHLELDTGINRQGFTERHGRNC